MELDQNEKEVNKTKYLGLIMSLMFIARFTRANILILVTFLATKSADTKQKDNNKALRILNYVVSTESRKIKFRSDARPRIEGLQ